MPVFPSLLMLSVYLIDAVDLVRTLCKLVFSLLWLENVDPVRQFRWIKSVGRRSPYTHTRLELCSQCTSVDVRQQTLPGDATG